MTINITEETINESYKILNLASNCTDEQLSQAYKILLFKYHPDLNPNNVEVSTKITQEINEAYSILSNYRKNPFIVLNGIFSDLNISVKITISYEYFVDKHDIDKRKNDFINSVKNFNDNPFDVIAGLKLIYAAFEAEQYKEIHDLLINKMYIDTSEILLKLFEKKNVTCVIKRWAEYLLQFKLIDFSIQLLESLFKSIKNDEDLLDKLRKYHYYKAKGYHCEEKDLPQPKIKILHLLRILDLGFDLDYIHKFLAEAYYDLGDIESASTQLKIAYKINPDLIGAKTISKNLGFIQKETSESINKRNKNKYIFTKFDQIPHPSDIREWTSKGNWEKIFNFADISHYSPKILPRSRATLRQIARSLGDCPSEKAKVYLTLLSNSIYWDVNREVEASLDRWGKPKQPQNFNNLGSKDQLNVELLIWNEIAFETYHPANDDRYEMAFKFLSNWIFTSTNPADVLYALKRLSRWLEILGKGEIAIWIRDLIRQEAPGTHYVDNHDRKNYIKNVLISDNLEKKLNPILNKTRSEAPIRLKQLLSIGKNLNGSKNQLLE